MKFEIFYSAFILFKIMSSIPFFRIPFFDPAVRLMKDTLWANWTLGSPEPIFILYAILKYFLLIRYFFHVGDLDKKASILLMERQMHFMKLLKTPLISLLTLCVFAISFSSCSKKESGSSNGKARMQIYLTDDPAPYEAVIIDVQDIKINYSSDTASGWTSLSNVNRGSYDLLRLVNDKDTLLADAELNTGRVQQIRLVLGPDNFVKV